MRMHSEAWYRDVATLADIGGHMDFDYIAVGLLGVAWYLLLEKFVQSPQLKWSIHVSLAIIAVGITQEAEVALGYIDSTSIVLDEFIAVPFIFIGYKLVGEWKDLLFIASGLVLYGLFDKFKPLGIQYVEMLPGGVGIVGDDLAAALLA